jgi:hypothetical protein
MHFSLYGMGVDGLTGLVGGFYHRGNGVIIEEMQLEASWNMH